MRSRIGRANALESERREIEKIETETETGLRERGKRERESEREKTSRKPFTVSMCVPFTGDYV